MADTTNGGADEMEHEQETPTGGVQYICGGI